MSVVLVVEMLYVAGGHLAVRVSLSFSSPGHKLEEVSENFTIYNIYIVIV